MPELETFDILDGRFKFTCSKHDDSLTESIRRHGIWEPGNTKVWKEMIKPGMKVADIGANWGYFTLIATDILGSANPVVCFEPNPVARELFHMNMKQNGVSSAIMLACALSYYDGSSKMSFSINNLGGSSIEKHRPSKEMIEVPVYRFDSLYHNQLDCVKIDTEGSDGKVLEGMRATIERSPNIKIICEFLIAFHPEPKVMLNTIRSLGLRIKYVTPHGEIEDRTDEWFLKEPCSTLYLEHA